MTFYCITLFAEYFKHLNSEGLIGSAFKNGIAHLHTINPREFTSDIHHTVDARPYGGGDGMVMTAEPLKQSVLKAREQGAKGPCIYFSPQGQRWDDSLARTMTNQTDFILVCGRYAGVDQRFIEQYVNLEISIGDYVVSGGELPAAIFIDSLLRLQPGVLGNPASSFDESFRDGLLEAPQLTRPQTFEQMTVPPILLSGDHRQIEKFKKSVAILRTKMLRPDLNIAEPDFISAKKFLSPFSKEDLKSVGIQKDWL